MKFPGSRSQKPIDSVATAFLATLVLSISFVCFITLKLTARVQNVDTIVDTSLRGRITLDHEPISDLRQRLPPSVWTLAGRNSDSKVASLVNSDLEQTEIDKAMSLCGKFLYSTLQRAVRVGDMGEQTFVATGDIDDMWTRDSAVQIGIYIGRMKEQPWLRLIIEGAIRRQAFNIIQDPYANAYEKEWVDPASLQLRDRVIGRGGWVATRNYELDSGAYFMTQLYDYYVAEGLYSPEALLREPLIFDAVMSMVDLWIVEQNHDEKSPYRYFELPNDGLGAPSAYTGMTWTGFRPSDDPCKYGYLIPSNVFASAGLERILEMNRRIWQSTALEEKATKLLRDIETGIRKYGVVKANDGTEIYAYEVDGKGGVLADFDDANIPSLLSIPLLGWSGYDHEVYRNTRKRILSSKTNSYYFEGSVLRGVGSPHTPGGCAWPMAFVMEALTTEGTVSDIAKSMTFQVRQSLTSACRDAMHESVSVEHGCQGTVTREWFEWSNALFVVLVETAIGQRCDTAADQAVLQRSIPNSSSSGGFYENKYNNDPRRPFYYQGAAAMVPHSG